MAERFRELAICDRLRGRAIYRSDDGGSGESELECAHEVAQLDPAHILPAAAEDAAQPETERREHLGECTACTREYDADAKIDDANVGIAGRICGGFPLLTHIGKKTLAGRRGFVEHF